MGVCLVHSECSYRKEKNSTLGMSERRMEHSQFEARKVLQDDIFICLRPLLKFGQFLGICPYRGLWSNYPQSLPTFRWKSPIAIVHMLITFLMGVNVAMNCAGMIRKVMTGQQNPIQIAWALAPFILYIVGFYTYVHFSLNASKLWKLFGDWDVSCGQIEYMEENKWIFWKVQVTSALVFTSAIFENVVYHMRYNCSQSNCEDVDRQDYTSLEIYYWKEHGKNWADVPYNPLVTVILFIVNKLTVLSTNFADVTIYTMAWILSSKLQGFVNVMSKRIEDTNICWVQVRKDFMILFSLTQQVSDFLSPVIFLAYTLHIELISTQIYLGITTDSNRPLIDKVYSIWSFLHLICRFMLVSILSSHITERCQDILLLLQKCPSEKFTQEVERLERLAASPQGLTGLGCFRISKPFILSVIQVIFTCEIIFLQATTFNKTSAKD